ncbi:EcoKI restriction-modification system protein HsdS [Clostridium ljungdahlii]|uniref:EcoKI restriction-modification system protein HsdS n=2 Tax=Clostridium ljungdahlii TaxID=1538 RepID=A0A162L3A6_9CLOT|nr:EcoKI restriction-modification system protein HsdS [Clostridium ljungdahlii]
MFGSPKVNPNNYQVIKLHDVIEYIGDIGSNGANAVISANLKMSDTENYALMVRTLNFTSNDFLNNVKYVSKDVYEFFKKSKVYGGEIIFNKIGSAGINFIMPNLNRPVSLGLNQIMLRTNEKINTMFLFNLLNTDYGKHQISIRVQGAVTKSITKGAIKEIPIFLPPIELQNQFADFVKQVDKLKFEMESK